MVDLDRTRTAPAEQFFDELGRIHAAMLGIVGSADVLQPMAPMVDRDTRRIYFFTKSDTDLAREVGAGAEGQLAVVGKDHDYHACVRGRLTPTRSREVIDRFWNPVVSAWFEEGKDDPRLVVLEFAPHAGEVWGSTGSTLKFGWEIARANVSAQHEPEVGVRQQVRF